MQKKLGAFYTLAMASMLITLLPNHALAAGISASGGGTKTVGQTFSINVVASGADFNAFQGNIATSGPVTIVSVSAGSANWMSQPSANGSFSGALLGQKVNSFTIATIKLKGNSAGKGAVTVSSVILKNGSATAGTSGGSAAYTIEKAPELPGAVKVESSTHADQAASYEATTITLSWNKEGGVDGFSYLLDQAEGTTPATKTTDANATVTYTDKVVGTYYFHIRAHKADGWGGTTHFKINIKEPDPKVNESLSKPSNIEIKKASTYVNNVVDGTVTGIIISGKTEPSYTVNIILDPAPTLPEGKTLSIKADDAGLFEMLIDFPIKAGFYKLSIQGQQEKILTPKLENYTFEITQSRGGTINILTEADKEPIKVNGAETKAKQKVWYQDRKNQLMLGLTFLLVVSLLLNIIQTVKRRRVGNKVLVVPKAIKHV